METSPIRFAPQLGIRSILSRSWDTLMRNPLVFITLAMLAALPGAIIDFLSPDAVWTGFFMVIVWVVLGLAVQGAIAYAVYQTAGGRLVSVGESISHGMSRVVPLFFAVILMWLATLVGLMLLVIPGLMVMCVLAVTVQACVVEKKGAIESLSRSAQLTKGYRLNIFFLIIITYILTWLVVTVMGALLGAILGVQAGSFLGTLIGAAPQSFIAITMAMVYSDLRAIKEGLTIDNLVGFFD